MPRARPGDPRSGPRYKEFRAKIRAVHAMQGRPCAMHVCLLPTRTIDYGLQYPHPAAWSLEHVQSIAVGGQTYDPANCAASHLRCNLSAGATEGNRRRGLRRAAQKAAATVQRHTSTRW